MDCSPPGSSVELSRQEYWSLLPFLLQGIFPTQGSNPGLLLAKKKSSVGFCHTLTWISHGFTCIPHPNPPSHLPLHPIPLGLPSAPGPSTCLMGPRFSKIPSSCHRAVQDTVTLPLSNSALSLSPVKIWDGLGEDQTIQSHLREIWRSRSVFFLHLPWHKYPAHPCGATGSSSVTGTCDNPCLPEWNQHALSGLLSICFIPEGCIIWLLISQGSGNKEVLGECLGTGRELGVIHLVGGFGFSFSSPEQS